MSGSLFEGHYQAIGIQLFIFLGPSQPTQVCLNLSYSCFVSHVSLYSGTLLEHRLLQEYKAYFTMKPVSVEALGAYMYNNLIIDIYEI